MKKHSIIRLAAFALIVGLAVLFSISFADNIHGGILSKPIDTDDIDNIQIDGSDFTPIFRLIGYTLNSFVLFLIMALNLLVIALVSVISCTIFRLAAIRKTTVIDETEMDIIKKIYFGSVGLAIIGSFVLTSFTYIIPILLYIGIWWLNTTLICYLPMKDHYWKDDLSVT